MDVFGGMVVLEANSQTAVMSVERAHRLDRVVAQRCKVRTDAEQRPQPRLHRQHPRCRQLHGNRTPGSGNVRIIRQEGKTSCGTYSLNQEDIWFRLSSGDNGDNATGTRCFCQG